MRKKEQAVSFKAGGAGCNGHYVGAIESFRPHLTIILPFLPLAAKETPMYKVKFLHEQNMLAQYCTRNVLPEFDGSVVNAAASPVARIFRKTTAEGNTCNCP